jgi:hypothetical protein
VTGREADRVVLSQARSMVSRMDPETAGLWPRASALLACRALEAAMRRLWEQHALELHRCPVRVQLICLRTYLDDPDLAARVSHAWSALSRACHHHAYELAPIAAELQAWFSVVEELIQRVD